MSVLFTTNFYPIISENFSYQELENKKEEVAEIKELHQEISYDPISKEISNKRWAFVWKATHMIVAVSLIALATFAIVFTISSNIIHLPIVSLTIVAVGLTLFTQVFKYLSDKSEAYKKAAEADASLVKYIRKIDDKTFQYDLIALGIKPEIETEKLKSIYAKFSHYKDEANHWLNKGFESYQKTLAPTMEIKLNQEVKVINPEDFKLNKMDLTEENSFIFKKIQEQRAIGDKYIYTAALCRLKAAYFLKLMQAPYEKRNITSFFQLNRIDPIYLDISKNHGDVGTEIFIKTPKCDYTLNDILSAKENTLAEAIFEFSPPKPRPILETPPKKSRFSIFGS